MTANITFDSGEVMDVEVVGQMLEQLMKTNPLELYLADRAGFDDAVAAVRHRVVYVVNAKQQLTGIKDVVGLVGDLACSVD